MEKDLAARLKELSEAFEDETDRTKGMADIIDEIAEMLHRVKERAELGALQTRLAADALDRIEEAAEELEKLLPGEDAKDSEEARLLASDTIDEIMNGKTVAKEAKAALEELLNSVDDMDTMIRETEELSRQQVHSMEEITESMEHIAGQDAPQ